MKFVLVIMEGGWKDMTKALEIISTLESSPLARHLLFDQLEPLGRCPEILLTYGRTIAV
jgi:hypothetical protein